MTSFSKKLLYTWGNDFIALKIKVEKGENLPTMECRAGMEVEKS